MKKPRFRKLKLALLLILVLFGASLAVRYYNLYRNHLEKQTRFMMDTYVTVLAVGPEKKTSRAIDLALDRMQEIDIKFNHLNPKSQVYAFNHRNEPITDQEIVEVIRVALEIARATGGAFDITVAPLVELWGFYGPSHRVPDEQEIKACLTRVGYQYLTLEPSRVGKSKADVSIDLGGIAKGYAVSQAAKALKEQGVSSALIDAGGDVFALGKKGGGLWKVGIRNPRGEDLLGYVEVENLAVMGSGDYERFFEKDGKRYHHIFNPKTGYPTEGVVGTTIIHEDPVLANAWSKPIFVLGPERGLEVVERIPGMEALVVRSSGEVLYSRGLKHALQTVSKNQ
ncbi:MAG: FAD:protein FMN transferase [Deltaproteobacteria bacterium]